MPLSTHARLHRLLRKRNGQLGAARNALLAIAKGAPNPIPIAQAGLADSEPTVEDVLSEPFLRETMAHVGSKGGQANTAAQNAARRANGKLGGRPRKKPE